MLAEALPAVHNTGERQHEAELYRLTGELRLQQDVPDAQEAEAGFARLLMLPASSRRSHQSDGRPSA